MAQRIVTVFVLAALLSGCGGNPWMEPVPSGPQPEPTRGITGLPGTLNPTARASITRNEDPASGNGNGFVSAVRYNAAADTFAVDGLAFDGANVYRLDRSVQFGRGISAFASEAVIRDPLNGNEIPQLTHRALYGSNAGDTMRFAIVRTGAYVGYGFGGFIYQRDGGFSLPAPDAAGNRGQGNYSGSYAGLRDFSGSGAQDEEVPELEYTSADMSIVIDYDDFNDGLGVRVEQSNRRVFDIDGNDITATIVDLLPGDATALPVLVNPTLGPGQTDASGEFTGTLVPLGGGGSVGTYYAVMGGENAADIVGIITFDPVADGRFTGVNVRETGGFVVTRNN